MASYTRRASLLIELVTQEDIIANKLIQQYVSDSRSST